MKKFIALIAIFFLVNQTCMADVLYGRSDFDLSNLLNNLESQLYDKVYTSNSIIVRVERLENTVFSKISSDSVELRIELLNRAITDQKMSLTKNREIFLEMMENRYFGMVFKEHTLMERVSMLESSIFGKKFRGNIDDRYENLIKKVPLNVIGISISESSGAKTVIMPEIQGNTNKPKAVFAYSPKYGDYLSKIYRYKDDKILHWKDIPVFVYINIDVEAKSIDSVTKAIAIWNEFIPVVLITDKQDANIVVRADSSSIITEPALSFYKDKISYKVIIHSGSINLDNKGFRDRFFLHQLGHSLGIWGHSEDPKDIMYDFAEIKRDISSPENYCKDISLNTAPLKPSIRDANSLHEVYKTQSAIEDYLKHSD